MHRETKHKIASVLTALFAFFFLVPFVIAKDGGKKTVQSMGFCVANGKVFSAAKSGCQMSRGIFFKNRKEALAWQTAHTNGFCYMDGRVMAMKKRECLKKRESSSRTKDVP